MRDTALVTLSHTVFKTSYTYDMATITRLAHDAGALTLWDLSHAAGSVLVDLNDAKADLAVGCTYKYLNGGPGSPAFLYVRSDLQETLQNPMQGWMGQTGMFDFGLDYRPAPGLQRFLTGTPPVMSMSAIEPGVDLLLEAGMERLRAKSIRQSEYLIALWEQELASLGFVLNSPRDVTRRGSAYFAGPCRRLAHRSSVDPRQKRAARLPQTGQHPHRHRPHLQLVRRYLRGRGADEADRGREHFREV